MSAAKVMRYTVVVLHPESNAPVALLADQPVPDWAKDLVHADDLTGAEEPSNGEPPRAGKGSGVDAWAEYAATLGIEVPEGASRDDVIALVDADK